MLHRAPPSSDSVVSQAVAVRIGAGATVLRRLRALAAVGREVEALIASLTEIHGLRAGSELVGEREPVCRPSFLVSGWAARVRWLPDGRRQVLSFILPGEGIGLCRRPNPLALGTTLALTPVQLLDATPVQKAIQGDEARWAGLREIVHISASYEEAFLLNQVQRLGRQTAHERMCHLMLEIRERLDMAGIGEGQRFPMPLTQEVLADATGLSIVHVNRILQQLRRERLLDLHGGFVSLPDPAALAVIADYRRPVPTHT